MDYFTSVREGEIEIQREYRSKSERLKGTIAR